MTLASPSPSPSPGKRRLYVRGDVAAMISSCARTVDRWVAAGLLPQPLRVRNRLYFDADAVDAALRELGR